MSQHEPRRQTDFDRYESEVFTSRGRNYMMVRDRYLHSAWIQTDWIIPIIQ